MTRITDTEGRTLYQIQDSGGRITYASGMVRDEDPEKVNYSLVFDGPLVERLAQHLTAGARKYEKRNWLKAAGADEQERFRESAARHFVQWLRGDQDEDHFAATVFNMAGVEYVHARRDARE